MTTETNQSGLSYIASGCGRPAILYRDGRYIGSLSPYPTPKHRTDEQVEADAKMFVAGPDLLRLACEVEEIAMSELSGLPANHEAAKAFALLRDKARAAIAKATA